jgi:hypothetical protein
MVKRLIIVTCFSGFLAVYAQQNLTMYTLQSNPQVNTLNPAFQNSCKIFIGLPVISSVHFNYGNDAFSYRNLFRKQGNEYPISSGNLSYGSNYSIATELYAGLIHVGFWIKDKYITFAINEKSDFGTFFSRDLFSLALEGNSAYEGEKTKLSPTGILFDYRREYALGIAWKPTEERTFGIKGKLLFGKLNALARLKNSYLYTSENTFDLMLNASFIAHSSAPVTVTTDQYGIANDITYNGDVMSILFNKKNLGLAFDLGFIHKQSGKEIISGSLLDLGFIRYTSSPYKYNITGDYDLRGITVTSNTQLNDIDALIDSAFNNFDATLTPRNYITFLPPRLYVSYQYQYTPKTNLNATFTARIYRYKINPALSLSASHQLFKQVYFALSWNYVNRTLRNVGAGIVAGRTPVQFYAFTDNIFGFVYPLSARNINARFGINLIFGCGRQKKEAARAPGRKGNYRAMGNGCGCEGMDNAAEKEALIKKLRKKGK